MLLNTWSLNLPLIREYGKGLRLSQLNLIKSGLKYLAPRQRIQFFLTSMIEENKQKKDARINNTVTYFNGTGKKYSETFIMDFSELSGIQQLGEPPLYKLAKEIEKIRGDIHRITSGSDIRVVTQTKEEFKKEQYSLIEEHKRKVAEQQAKEKLEQAKEELDT